MAILSPADLPSVLKLNNEEMKRYVLAKLGHPHVAVELDETQFEIIWKVVGDFIAGYFPREQRLSVFWTSPMKSTYAMPQDAYWIQSVSWDPMTTNISDIFSAEAYLFCVANDFMILDKFNKLQCLGDWNDKWLAKTPRGPRKLKIVRRNNDRDLPKIRLLYDGGIIEATSNHVIKADNKWRQFDEISKHDKLQCVNKAASVHGIEHFIAKDAISIRSQSGSYYGCTSGDPVLLH